jgi:hypothetical protein
MVYFLADLANKRVKIGKSKTHYRRTARLTRENSTELTLLGAIRGFTAVESWLHRKFAHVHLHNEWFEYSPQLRRFIREVTHDPGFRLGG